MSIATNIVLFRWGDGWFSFTGYGVLAWIGLTSAIIMAGSHRG